MNTYNIAPYFDDFNESDNYHQIMFKPGYAVQARELTQLQTILRGQIEKFGNHVFKHGSVVIPGNSFADLAVPYAKIQPTYNGSNINIANFDGKVVIGITSGIKAYVKKAVAASGSDPITFYLSYLSGTSTGAVVFADSEEVYLEDNSTIRATLQSSSSTGTGSLAFVNAGVYYINGTFVHIDAQSAVIDKYSNAPSCKVLLQINEQLVDSMDDTNLLDPAQGSYNYAAPGADRVKITLTLASLALDATIGADYVELMRYNAGVLEEHARNAKYSELEKSLARRTFDESGNYVVNGLTPEIREHLKQNSNGGVYADGDISKLVVDVSPGKSYINGFEIEKISKTRLVIDKARTVDHIKSTSAILRPEFGQYLLVSGITGSFSIYDHETVNIYNDNDQSNASATKIGTAKVVGVDYLIGNPGGSAIYKLWITDLTMIGTYTIDQAGGIRYGASNYAMVVTQYKAPVTSGSFSAGEVITHASSGRTATVRYWDNTTGTLYAYKHDHTKLTPKPGDLVASNAGTPTQSTIQERKVVISVGQSGLIFRLPKTIPSTLRNATTNSYDLQYTTQKELTIVTNASGDGSVSISTGTIDPIEVGTFIALGSSGILSNSLFSLNVPGTTLSITGGPTSSTVKVYAAVSKDSISPKTKTVTSHSESFKYWTATTALSLNDKVWYASNLYKVTVAGTTNSTAPTHISGSASNGTATLVYVSKVSAITLEKTDINSLTSIVDSVGDITPNFSVWNGQTDYSYNRGVITLKSGKSSPLGNFTITYNYYQHSIAGDFFCVDSYQSVSGFLDKQVVYSSDSTGQTYDLAACLDFRPSVASDGTFTTSGSRRNDLIISGTTFNSSLQFYVPRIDSLVVDAFNNINVIRGIPSETPVAPNVSTNQFELNRFYIPEYTRMSSSVINTRLDVERFTMADIQTIVKRIENLEDFATLTASELAVTRYDITDAETGLSRYKTGYLVESFNNPFTIARTTDAKYAASFVGGVMTSQIESLICDLNILESSSNYVNKNGYIMLPYTETVFASQPLSSRVTNINPFLVVKWDGVLSVNPPADDWVEVRNLPTVFESKTETVEVKNYIPCPPAPSYDYDGGGDYTPPSSSPATVTLGIYQTTYANGYSYTSVGAVGGFTGERYGGTTVAIGTTNAPAASAVNDTATYNAVSAAASAVGGTATIGAYQAAGLGGYAPGTASYNAGLVWRP